jgi:peptide-methionine (S)-S-oxide reductase
MTPDPNYQKIGDHSETVQVDYDPGIISYEQLLDAFWRSHYPSSGFGSNQYRSVIFYHNEAQETAAMESKAREEERQGIKLQTVILPYTNFYLAEDYHQKYYLRTNSVLFQEISLVYPDNNDLVNSTAAARLNSYVAGFGDEAIAKTRLDEYGLSAAGREELLKVVERGLKPVYPVP